MELRMEGFGGPWQPWNALSNPWAGAICRHRQPSPGVQRIPNEGSARREPAVAAHIVVSLAIKVVGNAFDNLLCQADSRRRLEEGQPF